MAELPTIEIKSWKNGNDKWRINLEDYDPTTHVLWGEDTPAESKPEPEPEVVDEEMADVSESEWFDTEEEVVESSVVESDDYELDEDNVLWVYIVNPDDQRAKLRIHQDEYDPDEHTLWSERRGGR